MYKNLCRAFLFFMVGLVPLGWQTYAIEPKEHVDTKKQAKITAEDIAKMGPEDLKILQESCVIAQKNVGEEKRVALEKLEKLVIDRLLLLNSKNIEEIQYYVNRSLELNGVGGILSRAKDIKKEEAINPEDMASMSARIKNEINRFEKINSGIKKSSNERECTELIMEMDPSFIDPYLMSKIDPYLMSKIVDRIQKNDIMKNFYTNINRYKNINLYKNINFYTNIYDISNNYLRNIEEELNIFKTYCLMKKMHGGEENRAEIEKIELILDPVLKEINDNRVEKAKNPPSIYQNLNTPKELKSPVILEGIPKELEDRRKNKLFYSKAMEGQKNKGKKEILEKMAFLNDKAIEILECMKNNEDLNTNPENKSNEYKNLMIEIQSLSDEFYGLPKLVL